jgi:ferredoxin-NADP reductase
LPKDTTKKLVFVAGGIGITPFRSMVKHLIDSGGERDIILFYMIADPSEISYSDLFAQAAKHGLRLVPVLSTSGGANPPTSWTGKTGYLTADLINAEVPDYLERTFYMSGPSAMVANYTTLLKTMKVPASSIKKDYFSGY